MLSVDDFNGRDFDNHWCALDFLLEAASVARDNLEKERRERLMKIEQIFIKALSLTKKRSSSRSRIGDKSLSFSMKEWFVAESYDKIIKKSQFDDISMKEGFLRIPAKKERLMVLKKRDWDSFESDINYQESGLKFKRQKTNLEFGAMPLELKDRINNMGGSKVVRVLKKSLYETDVKSSQGRLSIPLNQVREEFLTEEEKGVLNKRNGKRLGDVEAMLIEPSVYESTKLCLRRWEYSSSMSYALVRGWNSVVKRNQLKEGDIVELWSFRVGLDLWFALVVETGDKGGANTSSSLGIIGGEVASMGGSDF